MAGRQEAAKLHPMQARRSPTGLQILGVTFLLALALVGAVSLGQALRDWDPEKPFRDEQLAILSSLTENLPGSLTIARSGQSTRVTDLTAIEELLTILIGEPRLPYHHSHPEEEFTLSFEGGQEAYLLGHDSSEGDEYWFQLQTEASVPPTIKLFRSEALTSWFVRNGLAP